MITTTNLIEIIKQNPKKIIEAQLILQANIFATHFMRTISKNFMMNEGIDGENFRISYEEFNKSYNDSHWILNNIV